MSQKYLIRIAELERLLSEQAEALRQKDQQLSLVEETEAFLRSALTRAEEKIEEDEREIEHLRAQIEKLRRMLFGTRSEKLRREVELAEALLKQREQDSDRYSGREIADCQEQMTTDVRMAMEEIDTKTRELLTGVCTSLEEELNDYFRSGKRKEQQMLEEEDAEQRRSQSGLWGKISQWSGINNQGREDYRKRDFAPDSPEIKFSDRREALELMTQIESTVTSLHREAEAQFRPELEKIVSGIETGFRGTALYATENIAGRINARLEDEGFTVKISFPAVSQLQTRLAVKINLSALMEERTETVTRRRRQSGVWGTVCRWFGTSDLGWENYDEDVSRSVININKVREEVMSLTRAYFGELQASIEQDINQPVRQEIDAFFCAFREKVEQLRNTLIQSSEDHKRDQQAQERLTGRLQALNERVPELITDSKALREELETML